MNEKTLSHDQFIAEIDALLEDPSFAFKAALEVNELLRKRLMDMRTALVTYGKHKAGCASQWRASTGSSQIGPCDCGLATSIGNGSDV